MANLFGNVVPPASATDAPGWTLGSVIAYAAGSPPAVRGRWYMPAGITGVVRFRLYHGTTQALLASADFPAVAAGWQETVDFPSPVEVAGLTVVASVLTSASGHYPHSATVWPLSNPPASGSGGRFHNADAWPSSTSTTCYYADLVTAASTVDATLAATLPPMTAALSGNVTVTATPAATLPGLTAQLASGELPDVDISLGSPFTSWVTGPPNVGWSTERPRAAWFVGSPRV